MTRILPVSKITFTLASQLTLFKNENIDFVFGSRCSVHTEFLYIFTDSRAEFRDSKPKPEAVGVTSLRLLSFLSARQTTIPTVPKSAQWWNKQQITRLRKLYLWKVLFPVSTISRVCGLLNNVFISYGKSSPTHK